MKQYLLLCDQDMIAKLECVFKGIQFLEVQGMNLNGQNTMNILLTPVVPPVTQAYIAPPEQTQEVQTPDG